MVFGRPCRGRGTLRPMGPHDSPLVVQEVATLEELRDDWTRLAELDGDVFKTWEWARAWEETWGSDGRVLLTFGRPGEPLAGIARLMRTGRKPVRVVGFEGQGPADQAGPVCDPKSRPAVATALRHALATRLGRPGVMLARGLMREEGWAALLDGIVLQRRLSPVLDLGGLDWDGWLATKSTNFRQQVQRRERKLVRDHGLAYRAIATAGELPAAFEQLVTFHDARWQGESSFFSSDGRALHGAFARVALERGWLRLWVAELDGRAAAYWLGYRYGGDYWFFQLARDPEWHRTSIGMVLLAHTVRCAFEDRAGRYRFLSGDHEYKLRFANADAGHETVLVTSPRLAGPTRLGVAAVGRVPDPVKQRARKLLSH